MMMFIIKHQHQVELFNSSNNTVFLSLILSDLEINYFINQDCLSAQWQVGLAELRGERCWWYQQVTETVSWLSQLSLEAGSSLSAPLWSSHQHSDHPQCPVLSENRKHSARHNNISITSPSSLTKPGNYFQIDINYKTELNGCYNRNDCGGWAIFRNNVYIMGKYYRLLAFIINWSSSYDEILTRSSLQTIYSTIHWLCTLCKTVGQTLSFNSPAAQILNSSPHLLTFLPTSLSLPEEAGDVVVVIDVRLLLVRSREHSLLLNCWGFHCCLASLILEHFLRW